MDMSSFEEIYDRETVEAIESWRSGRGVEPVRDGEPGRCVERVRGWRGGVTTAAVVASGLTGVRVAIEDDEEPVVEELQHLDLVRAREAVTVLFVPGDPAGTVAFVRPWLLQRPGPAILAASA
jgi:hypothetical protein